MNDLLVHDITTLCLPQESSVGRNEKKVYEEFKPLGIKEYRSCWYLLGQTEGADYEYLNLAFAQEITPLVESQFDAKEAYTGLSGG